MKKTVIPAKAGIHLNKMVNWIPACAGMTLLLLLVLPPTYARYTPNDAYQEKRDAFESGLNKIQNESKKEKVKKADEELYEINQSVCNRFEEDVNKLAGVMEEHKRRAGITETRVAFGGVDTLVERADYWVNFAAEAIAYQRIQDYTPSFSNESGVKGALTYSMNDLKGDLGVLKGKLERAKTEVKKVL